MKTLTLAVAGLATCALLAGGCQRQAAGARANDENIGVEAGRMVFKALGHHISPGGQHLLVNGCWQFKCDCAESQQLLAYTC